MTADVIAECALGPDQLRATTGEGGLQLQATVAGRPAWTASFGRATRLVHAAALGSTLVLRYRPYPAAEVAGHGALEVALSAQIDAGGRVSLTLDAPADYPLTELLGPVLTPARPAGAWSFLVPDGEGLLLRGDGTGYGQRPRVTLHDHRITLPMTALLDSDGAALLVSAVAGHDHAIDLAPGVPPALGLVDLAAFGTWNYPREWRIATLPAGSGVAGVAGELSAELRRGGLELRNRSAKLRDAPERIRNSMGGTVLWAHFDTLTADVVGALEGAGVRELRIMGRPVDTAAREALQESGYASGPYFQTYDVFPTGSVEELGWRGTYPPEGASDGWPADLIRDMAGWLDPAWMYLPFPPGARFWRIERYLDADGMPGLRRRYEHDQVQVRSYRRCPSRHRAVIEDRALPMLDAVGASTVFFDIATAMWGFECYAPDHPCDRRQDVAFRREALATFAATGRPVFSEAGKWWAIDDVNGFEGLFSYDQELNEDCMQLTDYPEDSSRRAYEFNLEHRVPLFGMVARHAVTRTMWWGTGQDRHQATWPAKDAITALFGANPIFVTDPDHPLTPGTPHWERVIRTARAFDILAELTPDARVVSYETSGPHVGRTEFDGGATVEANVGFTAKDGLAPGQFVIRNANGRVVHAVNPADQ